MTVPLVYLTYANAIFKYGSEKFMQRCVECGIDGIIVPDVPYEEKEEFSGVCESYGIDLITMVAPTSNDRIKMIAKDAKGFVYCVSSLGVTGTRSQITTDISHMVSLVKEVNDIPCEVGFGISDQETARKMATQSDGVIVGSAIVKIIAQHGRNAVPEVEKFVRSLTAAVRETE